MSGNIGAVGTDSLGFGSSLSPADMQAFLQVYNNVPNVNNPSFRAGGNAAVTEVQDSLGQPITNVSAGSAQSLTDKQASDYAKLLENQSQEKPSTGFTTLLTVGALATAAGVGICFLTGKNPVKMLKKGWDWLVEHGKTLFGKAKNAVKTGTQNIPKAAA